MYWSDFYVRDVQSSDDVHKQLLWKNSNIKVAGKTILLKRWADKGILTVADICNDNGTILSREALCNKYGIDIQFLEYMSVISAIPVLWKELMKNSVNRGVPLEVCKVPTVNTNNKPKEITKYKCNFY